MATGFSIQAARPGPGASSCLHLLFRVRGGRGDLFFRRRWVAIQGR